MGWWTDLNRAIPGNPFTAKGRREVSNLWDDITGVTASENAADAQQSAADRATKTQLEMFNKSREDMAPWIQTGKNALARLDANMAAGEYSRPFGEEFSFNETEPQYGGPASFSFDMQSDPGVQFRLDAANKALERSAAAKGRSLGGGQLRALSTLNQGLASQEYGAAFDRFDRNRMAALQRYGVDLGQFNQNRSTAYNVFNDRRAEFYGNQANNFNRLASLANVGQVGSSEVNGARNQLGQALANNAMAAGNAQAAGYVGAYNNQANAIGGLAKLAAMYYGGG